MAELKILVIGSGGREHAIAWRLALEGHRIFCSPGNPGTAAIATNLAAGDYFGNDVDLTVVGPEAPLVAGVVDQFRARGLPIVGPTQEAAQLEGSKIHSKEFMRRVGIPTARFAQVQTPADGLAALDQIEYPIVVKADGLAAGKGVIIAQNREEAEAAVISLGPRLVIEEFLEGEEVSFIVLSDGKNVVPLEATQDHKAVGDGDTGPNTGGMGAYCDGRILSGSEIGQILETVIYPAVRAIGFTGFLYAGIMMCASGPEVLEFNVRLGDPETQALMHRLDDDFAGTLARAAEGNLGSSNLQWKSDPSVCVVVAAAGYPGQPRTGDLITLKESAAQVFHAGTRIGPRGLETSGGRVLGVTASGADLSTAIAHAYQGVERVHFDGMHFRRDIGGKGLKRWYN
jgi:phosphoribosylamine---glycine ligase